MTSPVLPFFCTLKLSARTPFMLVLKSKTDAKIPIEVDWEKRVSGGIAGDCRILSFKAEVRSAFVTSSASTIFQICQKIDWHWSVKTFKRQNLLLLLVCWHLSRYRKSRHCNSFAYVYIPNDHRVLSLTCRNFDTRRRLERRLHYR